MRLLSSIFVSALLRHTSAQGGFGTVLNKGAEQAGSIFVVHLKAPRNSDLYGPAPQALIDDGKQHERLFEKLLTSVDDAAIADALDRQRRFDPDCWIVEIELAANTLDFLPQVTGHRGS